MGGRKGEGENVKGAGTEPWRAVGGETGREGDNVKRARGGGWRKEAECEGRGRQKGGKERWLGLGRKRSIDCQLTILRIICCE